MVGALVAEGASNRRSEQQIIANLLDTTVTSVVLPGSV